MMATQLIPDPATEPTMSVARAAKIVSVGTRTAYDLVHGNEWPWIKVGSSYRILTAEFLRQYRLAGQPNHDAA